MSWVPSASPRLVSHYRDPRRGSEGIIPTVLNHAPGHHGLAMSPVSHASHSPSPMGHGPAPSGLSFGMPATTAVPVVPYQAPRPQQRQGSYTPAPSSVQASPGPRGLSPSLGQLNYTPARLGSVNNIPYTAPVISPMGARERALRNRSWTPLPVTSVLAGLERPQHDRDLDKLSHSLTMLPVEFTVPDLLSIPTASLDDLRMPDAGADTSPLANGLAHGAPLNERRPANQTEQQNFAQAPVDVTCHIYYQRQCTTDEFGRVKRSMYGNEMSVGMQIMKDILGVYHVGIEVHSTEYTFGHYRAPGTQQVGDAGSGCYSHEPQRPGPMCKWKASEVLGTTRLSAEQVADICSALGCDNWSKASYNRIHHNCVDFCQTLAAKLGVRELPTWTYRGQDMAKMTGWGGPDPQAENDNSQEYSEYQSVGQPEEEVEPPSVDVPPDPGIDRRPPDKAPDLPDLSLLLPIPPLLVGGRNGVLDNGGRSLSGTYVAPPPLPVPQPGGSLAGTFVAAPLSGTYVAPPPQLQPSLPSAEAALRIGAHVNVLQENGASWQKGDIIHQGEDGGYTILYRHNWSTEANVSQKRIVACPRESSFFNEEVAKMPPPFQGLASADSILEPRMLHNGQPMIPRNLNGRMPTWPSFAAPSTATHPVAPAGSSSMGGFAPQRASVAPPPPRQQPRPMASSFTKPQGPPQAPPQQQPRPMVSSFSKPSNGYPQAPRQSEPGRPTQANAYPQAARQSDPGRGLQARQPDPPRNASIRPMASSFSPHMAYPAGVRAPAPAPQIGLQRSGVARPRDSLGATWHY